MYLKFNHIAFRCVIVKDIADFFINVIGLEKGYRPPFNFEGYWLYSLQNKNEAIIHLFGQDANFSEMTVKGSSINNGVFSHIAFVGGDYPDFIEHLVKLNISFDENYIPGTNTKQVFVSGPEDITVEIDFINPREIN